jgi:U4/U6.U5 tri-snRNP-associated protein 2
MGGKEEWLMGYVGTQFYVLPEGYQVSDPSLQDMISVLNPRYEPSSLSKFSLLPSQPSFTLSAQPYFPGYIGLNNIRANDYLNVITQLLLHVPPIRDYLLDPSTPALLPESRPTELVKRFAALAKRVWNPRLFKAQVSPHEFLQEVGKRSEGKFGMDKQGDPVGFLGWLLNTLHRDLGGNKKSSSSESRSVYHGEKLYKLKPRSILGRSFLIGVIYKTFQGEVKIQTQEVIVDKRASRPIFDISRDIKTIKSPFLFLALDLPPAPIFQDLNENRIIPQVPLGEILAKYDGVTTQVSLCDRD